MPRRIVTETCPAPECNLSAQDVEGFLDEMTSYIALFAPAFQRADQLRWSKVYLHGLLGDASRKNSERIALESGEKVRSLQYFIGQSQWKLEPAIKIHQGLVAATLGETDGVALIDESGVVKQGDDSVGVAAQYCGSVGKVANSQVGKHLAVDGHAGLVKPGHELAVGRAAQTRRGVDANNPQAAKIALAVAAVTIGVPHRMHAGFISPSVEQVLAALLTLGELEYCFVPLMGRHAPLYSWHLELPSNNAVRDVT